MRLIHRKRTCTNLRALAGCSYCSGSSGVSSSCTCSTYSILSSWEEGASIRATAIRNHRARTSFSRTGLGFLVSSLYLLSLGLGWSDKLFLAFRRTRRRCTELSERSLSLCCPIEVLLTGLSLDLCLVVGIGGFVIWQLHVPCCGDQSFIIFAFLIKWWCKIL